MIKKVSNILKERKQREDQRTGEKIQESCKIALTQQFKKELKMKVDYKARLRNISRNATEINNLIRSNTSTEPFDILEHEMNNQETTFKQRLQLKKQKTIKFGEENKKEFCQHLNSKRKVKSSKEILIIDNHEIGEEPVNKLSETFMDTEPIVKLN